MSVSKINERRNNQVRPMLSNASILVEVPVEVTDDEVRAAIEAPQGSWTEAKYTTDPVTGHAKVDTPAGADYP